MLLPSFFLKNKSMKLSPESLKQLFLTKKNLKLDKPQLTKYLLTALALITSTEDVSGHAE
jgi:hypothetical protein